MEKDKNDLSKYDSKLEKISEFTKTVVALFIKLWVVLLMMCLNVGMDLIGRIIESKYDSIKEKNNAEKEINYDGKYKYYNSDTSGK